MSYDADTRWNLNINMLQVSKTLCIIEFRCRWGQNHRFPIMKSKWHHKGPHIANTIIIIVVVIGIFCMQISIFQSETYSTRFVKCWDRAYLVCEWFMYSVFNSIPQCSEVFNCIQYCIFLAPCPQQLGHWQEQRSEDADVFILTPRGSQSAMDTILHIFCASLIFAILIVSLTAHHGWDKYATPRLTSFLQSHCHHHLH